MKLRNYLITYYPESEQRVSFSLRDWKLFRDKVENSDVVRFATGQVERGAKNGKLHFQCYIELRTPMRITGLKSALGLPTLHCDARAGTQEEAIAYVTKDDTREPGFSAWDYGTKGVGQGKRSDMSSAIEAVRATPDLGVVARDHTAVFIRYHRGMFPLSLREFVLIRLANTGYRF